MKREFTKPDWSQLLIDAVNVPGAFLSAYIAFHQFSTRNQVLARWQCLLNGLQIGPLASYNAWKEKGRQVKRGEKAIFLCMPLSRKKTNESTGEDEFFQFFDFKPHWFVYAQTEGEPLPETTTPDWNAEKALAGLEITAEPFQSLNGNTQGYAYERKIAINPMAALPHKTRFHEIAHVVLGHTSEGNLSDSDQTPKNLREVEAESVALICCESLGMPGTEFSRNYIQSWLQGGEIPAASASKIFTAADRILKAGQ